MTAVRAAFTSFNGGELSPRMMGRFDTAIYESGLATCENFVPTVEGPLVKRPGFEYIRAAAATAAWTTGFRFNLTQSYLIEWSEAKLRFFTNGARIETSPGVAYEVTVPYSAAEAEEVWQQQSFDVLYLAHGNHPPAALTRTGASTFAYAAIEFTGGPFADGNSNEAATVTASATTGSGITLTCATAIFRAGHVGSLFRLEAADFSTIPAWEVGIDGVVVGAKRRSDGKVYEAASAGRTGTVAPTHSEGTEFDGSTVGTDINTKGPFGVAWTYLHDRFGIVRITAVAPGGLSCTADVVRRLPGSLTTVASWRWAYAAFSADAGWPNIVVAWKGRLYWIKNFEVCGSVAGDYRNHQAFASNGLVTPDAAFRRVLATEDPVLWAIPDRKLVLGTATAELAVGPVNSAAAVAGDNIDADPQSYYGSAAVRPIQVGAKSFFIQRGGRRVRQMDYELGSDRYQSPDVSVWARHITTGGLRQLTHMSLPEPLLTAVRADGQLAVHPHNPEQEVKGWARIKLAADGVVLSATALPSDDGQSDELWALIERDGAKSIEVMRRWWDDADAVESAFFVDSGLTVEATEGQSHFTGATHLAGREVSILAGGGAVSGVTVSGAGEFDLPPEAVPAAGAYTLTVGLAYTATAVTLRPTQRDKDGSISQSARQRLARVAVRVLNTLGMRVGALGGILDELFDRPNDANMDGPQPLFTGDSERSVGGNWDTTGQATIVSEGPFPCTLIAALPKIEAGS